TQMYNRRHERVGHLFQGRFTAILVEKEAQLCRYVVLNPVRAKMVTHSRQWAWSSYRATVGKMTAPIWLTTDWVLSQFGQRMAPAREHYRTFVSEGRSGPRPWEQLTGQIYLGSEAFVAQHQPNRVIRDVPRQQTQAQRPTLRALFQRHGETTRHIHTAYRQYGYRLAEIADHLGAHAATVSRRLKQAEVDDV
ncbi:MAG: addiction module toxin RelE, partial [Nitrospiraceae bacterium]